MRVTILFLVAAWAVFTVLSFAMPARIEGPRTLDTGLQRLDVFARWQLLALVSAVTAAGVSWRGRSLSRGMRWLGIAPAAVMALAILLGIVASTVMDASRRPGHAPPTLPTKPAPASG